ncbi:DUF4240 domain-containing protein [Deinococcus sp. RIT780]|uniref:DUF4240 domain-containing protein n=1 Tax=Deinococcus sp. RIT780 TaxID=2870472 RepID=UPI001C8A2098|nr:DUF4240 domain-containing protein [Deinococcus sp. RIT780]MBX8463689.1 DUF4240 domain-containing protein [Deinococcus sp. RIT780]
MTTPSWATKYPSHLLWDVIEENRPKPYSAEEHLAAVQEALSALPQDQLVGYTMWWQWALRQLFTSEIFELADRDFSAGTDDRFEYFRSGVIFQGQEVFEGLLTGQTNHERFEGLVDGQFWAFEDALYLTREVYDGAKFEPPLAEAMEAAGYQSEPYPNL